jgi:HD-like signal output (HDOD) protein
MDKLAIIDQIQKSNELLSMPQSISEILLEMEKPNYSAERLSTIILRDASLTSRILKLANSPFYHRFSEIKNVNQAIQVLGSTTVKCLALSSSVLNPMLVAKETGIDFRAFFGSVLTVAMAAQKIARELDMKTADEVFIAGLLHHIGVMFLVHHYPKQYRKIIAHETKARTLIDAEIEVFGIHHAEIGYQLAVRWHLPEYICEAIRTHHDFTTVRKADPIQNVIRLATVLVDDPLDTYGADLEQRITHVTRIRDELKLSQEQVSTIASLMTREAIEIATYLDVEIGSTEDLLMKANKEIWKTYLMVEHLFKERQELSTQLLKEERDKGAVMSKNIALATLSHYLNNAIMAISGRAQIVRKQIRKGQNEEILQKLPASLDVVERSVDKIRAVLAEMREISPIDEVEFYDMSQAMNLDARIADRMEKLKTDTGLVLPSDVCK